MKSRTYICVQPLSLYQCRLCIIPFHDSRDCARQLSTDQSTWIQQGTAKWAWKYIQISDKCSRTSLAGSISSGS